MIELRISGGQKEISMVKKILNRAHINSSKIKSTGLNQNRFVVYIMIKNNVALNALESGGLI